MGTVNAVAVSHYCDKCHLVIPIGVKPIVLGKKELHPDCFKKALDEARIARGIPNLNERG